MLIGYEGDLETLLIILSVLCILFSLLLSFFGCTSVVLVTVTVESLEMFLRPI